jgi:hypothetical protein
MNEQVVYDLVAKKKASLWSSIEDTIEELPGVIEEFRHANKVEDVEELLCIVVEKLGSAQTFLMESGIRISVLEDIKKKVVESLPNHQSVLLERDIEPVFTDESGDSLKKEGTVT